MPTDLPWRAEGSDVFDCKNELVLDGCGHDEEEADFIVRAVNNFDTLVAACELAVRWLSHCTPVVDVDGPKPLPVLTTALARAKE